MSLQKIEEESFSFQKKKSNKSTLKCFVLGTKNIPIQYMTKNYKSASKYALKNINSVVLKDGKIYNLLEQDIQKRKITCGCVKSNCQAKYCECFRWGQTCSDQCTCTGCKNKSLRKAATQKTQQNGCNCKKSGCKKKYCQCFQRGKTCGQFCNCKDCENKD